MQDREQLVSELTLTQNTLLTECSETQSILDALHKIEDPNTTHDEFLRTIKQTNTRESIEDICFKLNFTRGLFAHKWPDYLDSFSKQLATRPFLQILLQPKWKLLTIKKSNNRAGKTRRENLLSRHSYAAAVTHLLQSLPSEIAKESKSLIELKERADQTHQTLLDISLTSCRPTRGS
jgi:hypothetical protein